MTITRIPYYIRKLTIPSGIENLNWYIYMFVFEDCEFDGRLKRKNHVPIQET